jgi:gluconate 2-dehydrogenase gamma chain
MNPGDAGPADASRRRFLAFAAGGAAAVWLGARWQDLQASARYAARAGLDSALALQALTPAQADTLDALAAQIIPSDDTPGAREAQVVRFIDRALATFASEQQALFDQGLARLEESVTMAYPGERSFARLDSDRQVALIRQLEAAQPEFFEALRAATITGLLAHPEYGGNAGKVGWTLIGFQDRFAWQPPFGYYDGEQRE